MAKRFTDSDKWDDPWFRALSPGFKQAWQYLCDKCDPAGVIDLDRPLADFRIGEPVDWEGFLVAARGRVEVIENGKWFLPGFIRFQYGKLSSDCKAHAPVFRTMEKHGITERVSKGYPKGIHTLKDKDKEKEEDSFPVQEGGVGETSRRRFTPPSMPELEAYCREVDAGIDPVAFLDFYTANGWVQGKGKPIKDWRAAVRTWKRNRNDNARAGPPRIVPKTFEQLKQENSVAAIQGFINGGRPGTVRGGGGGDDCDVRARNQPAPPGRLLAGIE